MRGLARKLVLIGTITIILPLLWLIEIFWRVRISLVQAQRIGTLAEEPDMLLRVRSLFGAAPRTTHLLFAADPANESLYRIVSRHIPMIRSPGLTWLCHMAQPALRQTRFWVTLRTQNHEYLPYAFGTNGICFTDEEEAWGQAGLRAMGIGEHDWFVCFHARDSAYTVQAFPDLKQEELEIRNAPLETFFDAVRHISGRGGFAVRMGSSVERPLPDLAVPRVIDYATWHRSDFMDIYLSAKCRYFLGSNSGINSVPLLFDVPIGWSNMLPIAFASSGRRSILMPKLLKDRVSGEVLSFEEIQRRGVCSDIAFRKFGYTLSPYTEAGLSPVDNDSQDLLGLCLDLEDLVAGRRTDPRIEAVQQDVRQRFTAPVLHGELAPLISKRFLIRHRSLLPADLRRIVETALATPEGWPN